MFVRFKNDTMIGATVHLAGNVHDCDEALCKQLVAEGKAVEVEPPVRPGGEHPAHRDDRLEQHERLKEAEVIESGAAAGPDQARQATAMRQKWRPDAVRSRTMDHERYEDAEKAATEADDKGATDLGGGIKSSVVINPAEKPGGSTITTATTDKGKPEPATPAPPLPPTPTPTPATPKGK